MKFWRKYINGIFWTMLVLSELDVVWQAMNEWFGDHVAEGFTVLIEGTLELILIFAIFGIGIDLCNNIADIRDKTCGATTTQANCPERSSISIQSVADELEKYRALKEQGVITEEEFQAKKEQLLKFM